MEFSRCLRCVFAGIVVLFVSSSAWSQPSLRYIRVGETSGGASRARAMAANDRCMIIGGEAMGSSGWDAGLWGGCDPLDFAWKNRLPDAYGPGQDSRVYAVDLYVDGGAGAYIVPDDVLFCGGSVVGVLGGGLRPMVWTVSTAETTYAELPTPNSMFGWGEVLSLDDVVRRSSLGLVGAGYSRDSWASPKRAAAWRLDALEGSWTLEPLPDYGFSSQANSVEGITPCGDLRIMAVAAGWAESPGGEIYPQFWERDTLGVWTRTALPLPVGYVHGGVEDLRGGGAVCLTELRVVGWSETAGGIRHATLWASENPYEGAPLTWTADVLGSVDGYAQSVAYGLAEKPGNDFIVGTSYNSPSDSVGTLWIRGGTIEKYNLNDIVVGTQPDLVLRTATAAYGTVRANLEYTYIVGWGVDPSAAMHSKAAPGDPHAWLLTNDLVLTAVRDTPPRYDPGLVVAYPNPCTTGTRVSYTLPHSASVHLSVYDAAGRWVATLVDAFQEAGEHTLTWNGRRENGSALASGIYFVRLKSHGQVATRKVALLR